MLLTNAALAQLKAVLRQTDLDRLARLMLRLNFGEEAGPDWAEVRAAAEELGWVDPGTDHLTETGWFAADSFREFVFWKDRGRQLPFASQAPELLPEAFAGKSVLEIGSGSGSNLMSLVPFAASVTGLEPVGIYRQLGALLAETEGHEPIRTEPGQAEALPFDDAMFDTILCVSAHQYFDIPTAFAEISRVLKPGGEAILISGTLGSYALGGLREFFRGRLSGAKVYAVTVTNTLAYAMLHRRILVRPSKWSTAFPVYPSQRAVRRYMEAAGLRLRWPPARIGTETCFRATKPG